MRKHRGGVLILALALGQFALSQSAFCETGVADPTSHRTEPEKAPPPTELKFIPLPVYATDPNEGATYGLLPVFLYVEKGGGPTRHILAPSVTWNDTIHVTGTFRWYYYPNPDESLTLLGGASTHVNSGFLLDYAKVPRTPEHQTTEVYTRIQKSIFFRFFGFGPHTDPGDESSNTRGRIDSWVRQGYNITRPLNVGLKLRFQRDYLESDQIPPLPLTTSKFPGAPGTGGATAFTAGVSFRYDTRENGQYSRQGVNSDLFVGAAAGLNNSSNFQRVEWDTRFLVPEDSWIDGAARVFWSYSMGDNIPFYYQSSLGGALILRGFPEDRFIDKGAWEVELEQRIRLFSTHIYGVTTDWRVDPFLTFGQVYSGAGQFFSSPKAAGGLGFRAWVHPNVVGRVDIAAGDEGAKFYVELGYPF